jgi:hypothetical protein
MNSFRTLLYRTRREGDHTFNLLCYYYSAFIQLTVAETDCNFWAMNAADADRRSVFPFVSFVSTLCADILWQREPHICGINLICSTLTFLRHSFQSWIFSFCCEYTTYIMVTDSSREMRSEQHKPYWHYVTNWGTIVASYGKKHNTANKRFRLYSKPHLNHS